MNRVGMGLAVGAGYLLGRTKKLKLAFAIGSVIAGKRLNLTPKGIADLASQQLLKNPQFKEIGDQLRQDLRGVGKAASGAMVERQVEALADRLHGRTADVRDQLAGVVPDTGRGSRDEDEDERDERDEDQEPEEEYDEEPEDSEEDEATDEDESDAEDSEDADSEEAEDSEDADDEEPEPRRRPAKKAPAKQSQARKAPAKKTAARKAPAKKVAAKKTAAKKTAGKKTASSGGAARDGGRRTSKGGGER
ncbi:DNA primase [Streptomyces sp. NPDC005574]|uniref:DNA primase n=1 Tax=Streptomyces sp. NPDC005574 TaxID=3156891 RepID=UPI0033AF7849